MVGDLDESSPPPRLRVAGCVTRKDAVYNQLKVVLYLELFLPFLQSCGGGGSADPADLDSRAAAADSAATFCVTRDPAFNQPKSSIS